MAVKVELFDDLDAVERAAAGALDREAQPSLFDRLSWFRLTIEHCTPPGKPLIIRARDGQWQAWLFLAVHGSSAEALASWYTLRFGIVGDEEATLLPQLGRALRTRGISRVSLYPVAGGLSFGRGWVSVTSAASGNWRIATKGMSFERYWAERPSKLRNTAERKAKAAVLEMVVYRQFDSAAWEDYEAVYRASWKPEEGSISFLRALAQEEGAAGTLRLGIARSGEKPVAAQLWLVENGTATIHKLAYAEEAKKLSPGTILSMAMFRHALDVDRVETIDFGLGDDSYKADWMAERHPVYRVTAYNIFTLDGLAGLARAAAAKLVRRR